MVKQYKLITMIIVTFLLFFNCLIYEKENSITGIVGAVDEEIKLLEDMILDKNIQTVEKIKFITGKIRGRRIILTRTGTGKVNAAMIATLLIEHFEPEEVIFTGIAGAINPDLLPGDIVIAEKTAHHDLGYLTSEGIQHRGAWNPIAGTRNPVFFPADISLLSLAEVSSKRVHFKEIETDKGGRIPRVMKGIVVTGDVFVASSAKKIELRQNLQADVVEMEGAAVAQICWQQGVPCLVIRSISDSADERAMIDIRNFFHIAARNSAMLVADMVGQLASKRCLEK